MLSASEMRLFCNVMFFALRELKPSSIDQLIEQWSMMLKLHPASPPPSMVCPLMLPGRFRMKPTTESFDPLSPSGHWRFTTGYMLSHWANVVTTPEFIDAVQADNYTDVDGDLTFDGAVTRAELRW